MAKVITIDEYALLEEINKNLRRIADALDRGAGSTDHHENDVPIKAAVFTRHSADCKHKTQRYYRECRCRKWIYVYGKNQRISARTRSWASATQYCDQIKRGEVSL